MPLNPFGFFLHPIFIAACSQKHQGWKRHLNFGVQQLKGLQLYWIKSSNTSSYCKPASVMQLGLWTHPISHSWPSSPGISDFHDSQAIFQKWLKAPNPADITDGNSVPQEIPQLGQKSKRRKMQPDNSNQIPPACQIPVAHPCPCSAEQNPQASGKHWEDVLLWCLSQTAPDQAAFTLCEEVAWAQLSLNCCSTAEEAAPHFTQSMWARKLTENFKWIA